MSHKGTKPTKNSTNHKFKGILCAPCGFEINLISCLRPQMHRAHNEIVKATGLNTPFVFLAALWDKSNLLPMIHIGTKPIKNTEGLCKTFTFEKC